MKVPRINKLTMSKKKKEIKYPGRRVAMDGNTAAIMCERESTDAAGAFPITPSTQMGEGWAEAAAAGRALATAADVRNAEGADT